MFYSRGKNKKQNIINSDEMYKHYIKSVEDNPKYKVSKTEYSSILNSYFKLIIDHLFKGYSFKMPFRTGVLQISTLKLNTSKIPIDWKATQNSGKLIRTFNKHTNGKIFRILWDTAKPTLNKLTIYKFKAARAFSRKLAVEVKNGNTHFYDCYKILKK